MSASSCGHSAFVSSAGALSLLLQHKTIKTNIFVSTAPGQLLPPQPTDARAAQAVITRAFSAWAITIRGGAKRRRRREVEQLLEGCDNWIVVRKR